MCKNVGREGTANLVVIPAFVNKISQENERGLEIAPPPVGRGLTDCKSNGTNIVCYTIEKLASPLIVDQKITPLINGLKIQLTCPPTYMRVTMY